MSDRPDISDDDFEYGEDSYFGAIGGHEPEPRQSTVVTNQPHDEEVNLSDSDISGVAASSSPEDGRIERSTFQTGYSNEEKEENGEDEKEPEQEGPTDRKSSDLSGPSGYNALEYKHLNVSAEIRDLFKYIGRYKYQQIELETHLKPFIPDYIPAVGDIDEFIKVPRPDGKPDTLGLKVLDEPGAIQSDPTILNLQLRQMSKQANNSGMETVVGKVDHSDDAKDKKINTWIQNISDIHKKQPQATIMYMKPMPDIESLMQEWPEEVEKCLKTMQLPTGDLDVDLDTFVRIICNVLDIPVYKNPIESLHVLFTLYLEFKNNPYIRDQLEGQAGEPNMMSADSPSSMQRL